MTAARFLHRCEHIRKHRMILSWNQLQHTAVKLFPNLFIINTKNGCKTCTYMPKQIALAIVELMIAAYGMLIQKPLVLLRSLKLLPGSNAFIDIHTGADDC